MLPLFLRGVVVSEDDDATSSSEGAAAEPSSLLSLDFGVSIACGGELESVDSDDDDSDEDVVDGSVAAAVADGAVVTVSVLVRESFALYRLSPAKWF